MALPSFFKQVVLSSLLLAAAAGHAQAPAPDSARYPAARPLLLKAGLRITHLHYAHDSKSWQFLVPLSVGAEYRVAPRFSLYSLVEADLLASHAANRRRNAQTNAVSAASLSVGLRYYYGRSPAATTRYATPEFGKYLALDGGADWQQLGTSTGNSRRNAPAMLTPAAYVLWGIQNRLRPHLLYDLNAGLGIVAPAQYYHFERVSGAARWDAGAQVNIRLYFGR